MSEFFDAVEAFYRHLAAVDWTALGVALGFHLLRLVARAFAWRNILRAAYPGTRVPWWGIFGAYVAGVGVNSLAPARGGDVLKIVLAKRRIEGSTYPAVASSLLPETIVDVVLASLILAWTLTLGVFPSLDALPDLPTVDWHWPLRNPGWSIPIAAVLLAALAALLVFGARRVQEFWARVGQGLAILRRPGRFLAGVVTWQAASWAFRLGSVFFFLVAFDVPATLRNALLVLAVQSLSTLLPFTPGGIGTQQGLLVYVFRNAGVTRTALLSFSVGMQIALTAFNVVLGFAAILLMLRTLRWKRATRGGEESAYARGP